MAREAQPAGGSTVVDPPRSVEPTRTCVGCRRTRPRRELARFVRTPQRVRYDRNQRLPGRGAYVCPDVTCIEAATKRGAGPLRRALRGGPEREVREALDALRTDLLRPTGPTTAPASCPPAAPAAHREAPRTGDQVPHDGTVRSHRT